MSAQFLIAACFIVGAIGMGLMLFYLSATHLLMAREKEWMQWAADHGFTEADEFNGFPEYGYKGKHQ